MEYIDRLSHTEVADLFAFRNAIRETREESKS